MECNIYKTIKKFPYSKKFIEEVCFFVLKSLKKNMGLSIHIIADYKMKGLNSKYRGKNSTTDVLSFAISDGESFFPNEKDLGDIFISFPQIKRQAKRFTVSQKSEFTRMLVHGILHLCGYDHVDKSDEAKMMKLQEKLLNRLQNHI